MKVLGVDCWMSKTQVLENCEVIFWRCLDRMLKMLLLMMIKKYLPRQHRQLIYQNLVDYRHSVYCIHFPKEFLHTAQQDILSSNDGIRGERTAGAELTGYFRPTLSSMRFEIPIPKLYEFCCARSKIAVGSGDEIGAIGNSGACKNLLMSMYQWLLQEWCCPILVCYLLHGSNASTIAPWYQWHILDLAGVS